MSKYTLLPSRSEMARGGGVSVRLPPIGWQAVVEMIPVHGLSEESLPHPPATKSYEPYGRTSAAILTGWGGECTSFFLLLRVWVVDVRRLPGSAYVRICDSIKKVIEGINPDIVVVESLLDAFFDACYSVNCRFVMSTPNTPMDIERPHLPWLKGFWYYPMFVLPARLPSSH